MARSVLTSPGCCENLALFGENSLIAVPAALVGQPDKPRHRGLVKGCGASRS